MEEKLHRKDFATRRDYNRERMRRFNKKKHYDTRFDRYSELIKLIREYENGGADDSSIALKLSNECKYKLVIDKDLT